MNALCYNCVGIVLVILIGLSTVCSASSVIVIEDAKACFRRALAGRRVSRIFIRKAVSCERVEHCQDECAEEKRFTCEGFNYRLDPSGHGRGDCELLDVPYVRLDLRHIIPDPDYDYYEKDRNCKEHRPDEGHRPHGGDRPLGPPPPVHDWYSSEHYDHYSSRDRFSDRFDSHVSSDRGRPEYDHRPSPAGGPYTRRSDYYEDSYSSRNKFDDQYHGYHYSSPIAPFGKDYKSYEPYLPPRNGYDSFNHNKYYVKPYHDKPIQQPPYVTKWGAYGGSYGDFGRGHSSYGFTAKNYDYPGGRRYDIARPDIPKYWGEYGGTYGTGGYGHNYQVNDYWGLSGVNQNKWTSYNSINYDSYAPPVNKPSSGYLPPSSSHEPGYRKDPLLTFTNECSLRSATGYRLYKRVVKKILTVPTIYECEYACFGEKEFVCTSYAFRYVVGADVPPNNCYLSDRNYKELDYYTDLEQDRNFDIYTMNNRDRCNGASPHHRDSSECFLHVRSGQRFDDKCVKYSSLVKSIVDCELACLRSTRFICRTFSFRYGSAVIGGIPDNCQLTDIPYHELNPRRDFIFDPGFIVYERASFGYGCEVNQLPDLHKTKPGTVSIGDEICYVSYGWPAKLLPQTVRRIIRVDTEVECKAECTRARMETPFCCMSFTYKSVSVKDEANCFLSDIFQRDLLENTDYVRHPDYWLFSWDNTNPQCNFPDYYEQRVPFNEISDIFPGSLTWRIYSVGGWPCKRGSFCKQSELGFWFCELEGGSPSAWDYCCRPKHQCGYSEGFSYQWCYVGPSSTQWRKCNDKYYPYLPSLRPPDHHIPPQPSKPTTFSPYLPLKPPAIDYDKPPPYGPPIHGPSLPGNEIKPPKKTYLPPAINKPRPWITTGKPLQTSLLPPYRPGFRPDRPSASPPQYKPSPTLDEYEERFDNIFLDPPKPGGFGQPRHWPVSYLHKEMPPNMTTPIEQKFERMRVEDENEGAKPRYEAIQNLIEVIQGNDLSNIKYQITNASDRADDVLHVQIPLPHKFDEQIGDKEDNAKLIGKPIDLLPPKIDFAHSNRTDDDSDNLNPNTAQVNAKEKHNVSRSTSVYRRGFIEKTNVTNYGRSLKFL